MASSCHSFQCVTLDFGLVQLDYLAANDDARTEMPQDGCHLEPKHLVAMHSARLNRLALENAGDGRTSFLSWTAMLIGLLNQLRHSMAQ